MTLSRQAQKDLHKLALKRVDDAVCSIAQLLDDDEQVLHLLMNVATSTHSAAATFMRDHVRNTKGERPEMSSCQGQVLLMVADALGFEGELLTEEDAKARGLKC